MKGVRSHFLAYALRRHQPDILVHFRRQQVMRADQLVIMGGLGRQLHPAGAVKAAIDAFLSRQPLHRVDGIDMGAIIGPGDILAEPGGQRTIIMGRAIIALAPVATRSLADDASLLQQHHIGAPPGQRQGCREAGKAAADDGDIGHTLDAALGPAREGRSAGQPVGEGGGVHAAYRPTTAGRQPICGISTSR